MRTLIAFATLLALTAPAYALCVVTPDGAKNYPQKQEALLLCQHEELSDALNQRAAAEQLRAIQAQLQALELQQQQMIAKPFNAFEVPRF